MKPTRKYRYEYDEASRERVNRKLQKSLERYSIPEDVIIDAAVILAETWPSRPSIGELDEAIGYACKKEKTFLTPDQWNECRRLLRFKCVMRFLASPEDAWAPEVGEEMYLKHLNSFLSRGRGGLSKAR